MRTKCYICYKDGNKGLCPYHKKIYKWDSSIQGFRLKKKNNGSRYTKTDFHKNEIKLTKILEQVYGSKNIITSYHPIWAESVKQVLLEYDIFIKTKNILVEYNGRQHYEYVPFFHSSYKDFLQQKRRDSKKKRLAKNQGVQLVIIKYDEPMFKDYIINKIEGKL
jgi:hypothetical protein